MNYSAIRFLVTVGVIFGLSAPSLGGESEARSVVFDNGLEQQAYFDARAAFLFYKDEAEDAVRGTPASIVDFELNRELAFQASAGKEGGLDEPGSCTVSATVSVPGVAEVTISATASTCSGAMAMVLAGIQRLLEQYDILPD